MKTINVDMYQTLAVAVGVLYLGGFLINAATIIDQIYTGKVMPEYESTHDTNVPIPIAIAS